MQSKVEIPQRQPATAESSGSETKTDADHAPTAMEDHTLLYKGATLSRLQLMFIKAPALNFNGIRSGANGDFNKDDLALYFSKQSRVAEEYAQWSQHGLSNDIVKMGILTVAVPNHLLANHVQVVGDEWQDFVFLCKREDKDKNPAHDYLLEFDWLVGPICGKSPGQVVKMKDKSELVTMKVSNLGQGPEAATQHVTMKRSMWKLLDEHCVGKVWLEAVPSNSNIGK